MAHYSTTGAPAWAITTWVDDNFVYTQIPAKDGGAPLIQKYPLTFEGLSASLSLMRAIHHERRPVGPMLPFSGRKPKVVGQTLGTESQREAARQVLKRLKLI